MTPQPLVVLTTLGTEDQARRLVRELVAARVVACGTLLPGARSVYRWEGAITEEAEVMVVLKTSADRWDDLVETVNRTHPYAVPELLALPVERGLARYVSWLTGEISA